MAQESREFQDEQEQEDIIIRQRNIFTVVVNKYNQLLVEEEPTEIQDLRQMAIEFLDNGGGQGEEACDFCQGKRDSSSSDNPQKAIISLKNESSFRALVVFSTKYL